MKEKKIASEIIAVSCGTQASQVLNFLGYYTWFTVLWIIHGGMKDWSRTVSHEHEMKSLRKFPSTPSPPPKWNFFLTNCPQLFWPNLPREVGSEIDELLMNWSIARGQSFKKLRAIGQKKFSRPKFKKFTQIRSWSKVKILSNQNFSSKLPQMRSGGCCASFKWFWKILKKLTTKLAKKFGKLTNFPPGIWSISEIDQTSRR